MTDKPVNPTFAQGDSSSGLFHAGEAPPAGHAFYPEAHCGAVMTGERFESLPRGADLCATDAKWLGITDDKPQETKAKETPKAPEETKPTDT